MLKEKNKMLSIRNDLEKFGYAKLENELTLSELVNLDELSLINTEERNRDNNINDLPDHINAKLKLASVYLKEKYLDKDWPNNSFFKYTVWNGVDKDNQGWHTDMFESYDMFFLFYNDDTYEETGGSIQFKWKEGETFESKSFQPKKGDIFLVSNSRGFWHRAESTKIQRRVISFDFLTNE
jgi:hypothetical protein